MSSNRDIKINILDKILVDIVAYSNPDILLEPWKSKIDTANINKKRLKKYFLFLISIKNTYDKIMRYSLYFSEFYPESEKIKKSEALYHHIHAYLEDLDILKDKTVHFLETLKNDLKQTAVNKKEINSTLKTFVLAVRRVFQNVSDNRNPHHHRGMRFIDGNLVDAETMNIFIQDNFSLKEMVNVEIAKRRAVESFEKAKKHWVTLARKNETQISGLINEVFKRNKKFIYTVLKIKPIEEI